MCSQVGAAVIPWGGGVHMGLGGIPKKADVILALGRLNHVLDHEPGDMTSTVEAGMVFTDYQAHLGRRGQFLSLDPPGAAPRHHRGHSGREHQRPAPASLRHGARPAHRPARRGWRRDGDQGRSQGRQERHRLRYEQALRGLLGHAGCDRRGDVQALPHSGVRAHLVAAFPTAAKACEVVAKILDSPLVPSAVES